MTDYTKTTNFAAKDSLPSGNANKIVKGAEIDTEFNNIATASATKANIAGPTFTGTVTIPTADINGGAVDGTTIGAASASSIVGTTIVANTSINIAGDGATVTGIKDEDDMSSDSATKLATQQSIKAYVDSQVTAQDLDVTDGSSSIDIDLDSESLGILGGTGIDSTASGTGVTLAIDSTVTTLTGSQTLTNKTLTAPTLTGTAVVASLDISGDVDVDGTLETDALSINGTTVTSTAAELNILDGVTSTAAELNILDGVTSTTAELNILDGVTSTAAELNILDGKAFLDEDDMSSNSATGIASQQSIKAYVDAQITAEDLDFQADSGGALSIDLDSETLTFTGGTGIDTSGSGNAVTFAIDSTVATLTGSQTLTNKTLTSPDINTPDIDGGAIDGTTIGGSTPAAGSFTTLTASGSATLNGGVTIDPADGVADDAYALTVRNNEATDGRNYGLWVRAGSNSSDESFSVRNHDNSATYFKVRGDGNVNIGGTSGLRQLTVENTSNALMAISAGTSHQAGVFYYDGSTEMFNQYYDNSADKFYLTSSASANQFVIDRATGNVGIGSATANHFSTAGTANVLGIKSTAGGLISIAATGSNFSGIDLGTDTIRRGGMYSLDGSNLAFYTNATNSGGSLTEAMRITSGGSVGIGRSDNITAACLELQPPAQIADFSSYILNIGGDEADDAVGTKSGIGFGYTSSARTAAPATIGYETQSTGGGTYGDLYFATRADGGTGQPSVRMRLTSAGALEFKGASTTTNAQAFITNDNSTLTIGSSVSGSVVKDIHFNSPSTMMVIDGSSGNVGIGTSSAGTFRTKIKHSAASVTTGLGIEASANDSVLRIFHSGSLAGFNATYSSTGAYVPMVFNVGAGGEAMRIRSDGNVGIGSSGMPAYSGNVQLSLGPMAHFMADTGSYANGSLHISQNAHFDTDGSWEYIVTDEASNYYQNAGNHVWRVAASGTAGTDISWQEAMRIDSVQRVHIGHTQLNGDGISLMPRYSGSSTTSQIRWNRANSTETGIALQFMNNAVAVGSISHNNSSTTYSTSSDQRLKQNIQDAADAGELIDAIQVRQFDWKVDGSHQRFGMVAQELTTVAPEAVSTPEDPDEMMGVDYSKLVPMLIKEIQTLRSRVQQLENN